MKLFTSPMTKDLSPKGLSFDEQNQLLCDYPSEQRKTGKAAELKRNRTVSRRDNPSIVRP
jgi:hypothetical protein